MLINLAFRAFRVVQACSIAKEMEVTFLTLASVPKKATPDPVPGLTKIVHFDSCLHSENLKPMNRTICFSHLQHVFFELFQQNYNETTPTVISRISLHKQIPTVCPVKRHNDSMYYILLCNVFTPTRNPLDLAYT